MDDPIFKMAPRPIEFFSFFFEADLAANPKKLEFEDAIFEQVWKLAFANLRNAVLVFCQF